jgi:hypothetical protein
MNRDILNKMFAQQFNESVERDPRFADISLNEKFRMKLIWFSGAAGALNALMESEHIYSSLTRKYLFPRSVFEGMREECQEACDMANSERKAQEDRREIAEMVAKLQERINRLSNTYVEQSGNSDLDSPICPIGSGCPVCDPGIFSEPVHNVHSKSGNPPSTEFLTPGQFEYINFGGKVYHRDELSGDNPAIQKSLKDAASLRVGGSAIYTSWGPINQTVLVTRKGPKDFRIKPYTQDAFQVVQDEDEEPELDFDDIS